MAAEERVIKRNMTEWNFSAMTLLEFFISRGARTTASPGESKAALPTAAVPAPASKSSAADFQGLLLPLTSWI